MSPLPGRIQQLQPFTTKHLPGEHGESPKLTEIHGPAEPGKDARPVFASIEWQDGPIKDKGVNGVQAEQVIDVLIERLETFQAGRFACPENGYALDHLREAKRWLDKRTAARRAQGVEGQNAPHDPA